MTLQIRVDAHDVPHAFEQDPESGQFTAYNDDLRVMAIGQTREEAEARFVEAVEDLVTQELSAGRPLPEPLRG